MAVGKAGPFPRGEEQNQPRLAAVVRPEVRVNAVVSIDCAPRAANSKSPVNEERMETSHVL
jgi:hypothetical protein